MLSSHGVHGDVTPLLVTRKRTEWYISSLSSPRASESGVGLGAGKEVLGLRWRGLTAGSLASTTSHGLEEPLTPLLD